MEIAGAILSGGKNERMAGKNKAFLEVDGVPVIQTAINTLGNIFKEVILVTNTPEDYQRYAKDCLIVRDLIKDIGPLGGIHAALSQTSKQAVFFIACDMPFLHNDLIVRQLALFNSVESDALVPRINSQIEPIHAVYRKSIKEKIETFLREGKDCSIRSFLTIVNVSYFDLEDTSSNRKIFKNLNTPQDWEDLVG